MNILFDENKFFTIIGNQANTYTVETDFNDEELSRMIVKMKALKDLSFDWLYHMDLCYRDLEETYRKMSKSAVMIQDAICRLTLLLTSNICKLAGSIPGHEYLKVFEFGINIILQLTQHERNEDFAKYCLRVNKVYKDSNNHINATTFAGQLHQLKIYLDDKYLQRENWKDYRILLSNKFGEDENIYLKIKNILINEGRMFLEGMFFSKTFIFYKQKNFGLGAPPVLQCKGQFGYHDVYSKKIKKYFENIITDNNVNFFWEGTAWEICSKCAESKSEWFLERLNPLPRMNVCHKLSYSWRGHTVYVQKYNLIAI